MTAEPLPVPPATEDWTAAAKSALANIYLNDQLGDCVIAMGYHFLATWTGNAGNMFTATDGQIIADYSAIGGYVPGRPGTDQGCDEQTALNYWQSHGFADGSKLLGWMAIDASKPDLLRQAIFLFENVCFGVECPNAWLNPEPETSGFTWDVAGRPNPNNGHAFVGVGYTAAGITIDTWGMLGTLTWAAAAEYATTGASGECYVAVSAAQLAKAQTKAPNGVDWSSLLADFNAMGGNVPVPAPAPAPAPSPAPIPAPPAPVIGLRPTTLHLVCSAQPITFGQPASITAAVQPADGQGTNPTGVVVFNIDDGPTTTSAPLTVVNGISVATFPLPALPPGNHGVGAQYYGDAVFVPGPSQGIAIGVTPSVVPSPAPTPVPPVPDTSRLVTFNEATQTVSAPPDHWVFAEATTECAIVLASKEVIVPPDWQAMKHDGSHHTIHKKRRNH